MKWTGAWTMKIIHSLKVKLYEIFIFDLMSTVDESSSTSWMPARQPDSQLESCELWRSNNTVVEGGLVGALYLMAASWDYWLSLEFCIRNIHRCL